MLQRLTEDLEYHHLLDKAVHCTSSVEQMCLVAAFSVSSYSTTVHRIAKPFNPMLGETFELDRLDDMGLRSLCEQVSSTHAPLIHSSQARACGAKPVSSWASCSRGRSGDTPSVPGQSQGWCAGQGRPLSLLGTMQPSRDMCLVLSRVDRWCVQVDQSGGGGRQRGAWSVMVQA